MSSGYKEEQSNSKGIPSPFGLVKPFRFEPWKDFAGQELIPITEPPCKHCKWFKPRIKTMPNGEFDGVVLCTRPDDMNHDFSCFQAKEVRE